MKKISTDDNWVGFVCTKFTLETYSQKFSENAYTFVEATTDLISNPGKCIPNCCIFSQPTLNEEDVSQREDEVQK